MKGILKTVVIGVGLLALGASSPAQDAPRLRLGDPLIAFVPGQFSYDRHRGTSGGSQEFPSFGLVGQTVTVTDLDILPHNDWPDLKGRVTITLAEDAPPNPSGLVTVRGYQYHRDPIDPTQVTRSSVHEHLQFTSAHSKTTAVYFDEVTSIETPGLGMYVTLTARWWFGHEQEMNVAVAVDALAEADCGDYVAYFNGQEAAVEWNEDAGHCAAGLIAEGAERGLYFGLDAPGQGDAFFGHPPERDWEGWLDSLPYGGFFFDVQDGEDTMIRPIVVDLVRRSDAKIVDTARVLLAIEIGPGGHPMLVPMPPAASMPGAFAQLSPRGLGRLDPTHVDTLPYPIVPAGTQPRLSERAIGLLPRRGTGSAATSLAGERYWTRSRGENGAGAGAEFAGHLAYEDILEEARRKHRRFVQALGRCSGRPPLLAAICAANATRRHCVRTPPVAGDFTVRVDGLTTYFDPARREDALVVGDVNAMELAFGSDDDVTARFVLASITGKMEGRIDPADVRIEYTKDPLDPCTIKPDDRVLSEVAGATDDYAGWLVCPALGFSAASASMADPLPFDLVPGGESLFTPVAGTPEFTLAGVGGDGGSGTCGQPWMAAFTKAEIVAWAPAVANTIESDWVVSPGQDEALDRLLSPFELGIERVDAPPEGTPAYAVHPLGTYTLSARIGSTDDDTEVFRANTPDGLYIPYITRSSPIEGEPYLAWFCPFGNGQRCDGVQGTHDPSFPNGRDPDGDPFDVALSFTSAHLNQALWAQARRQDRLGAPSAPARLAIGPGQVALRAAELGYFDVVSALLAAGQGAGFGIRYHQAAAPYALVVDEPPRLWYVAPNIIVELVSLDGAGGESVAAKFVVDVVEKDLQLTLATGGASTLDAAWRDQHVFAITSTYLPGCYRDIGGGGCADRLREVVGELVRPAIETALLELITRTPTLQLFDAGQESARPRHVTNPRTFLGPGVNLFGDLCRPGTLGCP